MAGKGVLMENTTTQKLTRRNALLAALAQIEHDANTDAVCERMGWARDAYLAALKRAADASRTRKSSGEPSATQIANDNLMRGVVLDFIRAYGEPVTSSIIRDNVAEVASAQKASAIIARGLALDLLEVSPYVREVKSAKTGKVSKRNVAYQVKGFDWSEFEPKTKAEKAE